MKCKDAGKVRGYFIVIVRWNNRELCGKKFDVDSFAWYGELTAKKKPWNATMEEAKLMVWGSMWKLTGSDLCMVLRRKVREISLMIGYVESFATSVWVTSGA